MLAVEIDRAIEIADGSLELDFAGVDAVTPSFVDELLELIDKAVGKRNTDLGTHLDVFIVNPPTRLSSKFSAVGRARGYEVSESTHGRWLMARATQTHAP